MFEHYGLVLTLSQKLSSNIFHLTHRLRGDLMTIKVAINGYGRIGRNILQSTLESSKNSAIQIVAINDLSAKESCAHLTHT